MVAEFPMMLQGLIDDAAVFPPGDAPLADAVPAHRGYLDSWFAPLVGPLLVPASCLAELGPDAAGLRVGVVVDVALDQVASLVAGLDPNVTAVRFEARASGSEALGDLVAMAEGWAKPTFAEIPIDEGRDALLDLIAETALIPKFRTGGLTAALFPTPEMLASAIVGCARRSLPFKLTAGLHRALRHRDPETGFSNHGFLNVLIAAAEAEGGASVKAVTTTLRITEPGPLVEDARRLLDFPRPLWAGFGSCSITEPLDDLTALSLLNRGGSET